MFIFPPPTLDTLTPHTRTDPAGRDLLILVFLAPCLSQPGPKRCPLVARGCAVTHFPGPGLRSPGAGVTWPGLAEARPPSPRPGPGSVRVIHNSYKKGGS